MKKKLSRIIAILLACFVLFGFGSCDVDDPEMQPSQGEDSLISMYGTKVLYRPDTYDFNINSGGSTEKPNDYYGDYAYSILRQLYYIYGISDDDDIIPSYFKDSNPPLSKDDNIEINNFNQHNTYFLYDSIRYQINSIGEVADEVTIIDDGKSMIWNNTVTITAGPITNIITFNEGGSVTFSDGTVTENEADTKEKIKTLYNYVDDESTPAINEADQQTTEKYQKLAEKYNNATTGTYNDKGHIILGANQKSHWNWNFALNYNASVDFSVPLIKTDGNSQFNITNNILDNSYKNKINVALKDKDIFGKNSDFNDKYNSLTEFNSYRRLYLGTTEKEDYKNYSDYVKALEYVIYCYALDLEPQAMSVSTPATGDKAYIIQIGAYTPTAGKSSADVALEDIKTLFNRMGSMVGLMDRQIDKLKAWIKENVIGFTGNNPSVKDDYFYVYDYNKTVEIDTTGNSKIYYVPVPAGPPSPQRVELGRDYDRVVDEIVQNVVDQATIGKNPDGTDVNVNEKYLASEIMEYSGDTFMVNDDSFFPKYEPGQNPRCIRPLEYQSAVLMFSKPVAFTDVAVILKYDADGDGTEKGKWDMNKYLDIIVELNYYNYQSKKMFTLASEKTRVYDGPYEWGVTPEDYPEYPNLPADHGIVGLSVNTKAPELQPFIVGAEEGDPMLYVNTFNTNIGGGILKTDASSMDYCNPLIPISTNPLVIVGTTDVRKYYSIVEPTDGELGSSGQTYLTGRLNPKMFEGNDGCDYLEITYKVLKDNKDTNKNYKFYTSLWTIL